jgi:DNA-directed RNA polymerase I, II, and III subunit RPABC1
MSNICCFTGGKEQRQYNYNFKDVTSEQINKLFKIKITQLKMVRARGYDISREEGILGFDAQQFADTYIPFAQQNGKSVQYSLSQVYFKPNDPNGLIVYYADPVPSKQKTLNKEQFCVITRFLDLYQDQAKEAIVIVDKTLGKTARNCLCDATNYHITVFQDYELLTDITEHYLVPKHTILTDYEANQLLTRNQDKDTNVYKFLIIKTDDPVIKYLGGKADQIVKIDRINFLGSMVRVYEIYRLIVRSTGDCFTRYEGEEKIEEELNAENNINTGEEGGNNLIDFEGNIIFDNTAPVSTPSSTVGRGRGRGRGRTSATTGGRGRGRGRGRGNDSEDNFYGEDNYTTLGTTGETGIFGEFQGFEGENDGL